MAYSFRIYPEFDLIGFRPSGILSAEDMNDYFQSLRAHPDYRSGLDRLVDNTDLIDVDLDYAQIRNIQRNETFDHPGNTRLVRTAFVTGDAGFGLSRMYQSVAEGRDQQQVAIFDNLDPALRFLRIDPVMFARASAAEP